MADRLQSLPINAPGAFYVDWTCTDCGACVSTAPAIFGERHRYAYVKRQPATPEESALAQEALDGCPGESIGSDGELGREDWEGWARYVEEAIASERGTRHKTAEKNGRQGDASPE